MAAKNTDIPLIRRLSVDDVDAFRAIRQEALTEVPSAFASTAEDLAKLSDTAIRRMLADTAVFAVLRADAPVALMGVMRHAASKMAHRGILVMVYVRAAERGRQLADSLFAAVMEHARATGLQQLELAVTVENSAALAFYRRVGFAEVGRIPAGLLHEGREIDEILMMRQVV